MPKQFYFKQFRLAQVEFSSIWPIDRTLSGVTTLGQIGEVMAMKGYSKATKSAYKSYIFDIYLKKGLEMIFIIKMHWKWFFL